MTVEERVSVLVIRIAAMDRLRGSGAGDKSVTTASPKGYWYGDPELAYPVWTLSMEEMENYLEELSCSKEQELREERRLLQARVNTLDAFLNGKMV